jgi:hypothetical protein
MKATRRKVWIDLDNSPHVPFFVPIVEELQSRGYSVVLTARDCFQVVALADLHGLQYERIGRHYGKSKFLKVAGVCARAAQLAPAILREKPDLALSHGSRSQLFLAALLRVPSVVVMDYEFVKGLAWMKPNWVVIPDLIPDDAVGTDCNRVLRYPGIKEDVYVHRFRPDARIRTELGLTDDHLVVTLRPPANEAHYHNPESEALFDAIIRLLSDTPRSKVILLPRNERQGASIREAWPHLFAAGKILIPGRALDGLNLIWHSDLVISGGGTMNREAAALGVPVYSIFRGKIGAVDRYLADRGRLVLLETVADVRSKIALCHRSASEPQTKTSPALKRIVAHITSILEPELAYAGHTVQ